MADGRYRRHLRPSGAVLGALSIGLVEEVTVAYLAPSYRLAASFVVILVMLSFRPRGILGTATR
jgi:branched-subunit amino acid ABC-type transport system permease component